MATSSCYSITVAEGLRALTRADTVVVPGYDGMLNPPSDEVIEALRDAAGRGRRMASICTGAFALAYAGLLDGRRATTHWAFADEMRRRCGVTVDSSVLYVDEGRVLTSAGLSAGIDLCLHIIRSDHGERIAAAVARAMVAAPHRDGGQAQFIERPLADPDGTLVPTRDWAIEHLEQPLTVAALADHALMSPRTFARRFKRETGTTPHQWLVHQRVLEAQRLLETTDLSVEEIATKAGFGSAPALRESFRRTTRTTPTAYRRTFRARA